MRVLVVPFSNFWAVSGANAEAPLSISCGNPEKECCHCCEEEYQFHGSVPVTIVAVVAIGSGALLNLLLGTIGQFLLTLVELVLLLDRIQLLLLRILINIVALSISVEYG